MVGGLLGLYHVYNVVNVQYRRQCFHLLEYLCSVSYHVLAMGKQHENSCDVRPEISARSCTSVWAGSVWISSSELTSNYGVP